MGDTNTPSFCEPPHNRRTSIFNELLTTTADHRKQPPQDHRTNEFNGLRGTTADLFWHV
jgi:hypothetical protein